MSETDEELFRLMMRIRDKVADTVDLVEQSNYDALPGTKTTLLAYQARTNHLSKTPSAI